ncbi:hypothetical protein ACLK19_23495 [Escherichia coli]
MLSEYSTRVGQHEGLYKAYRDLRDGDHYATLNTAQKKAVDNALRRLRTLWHRSANRETTTATVKLPPVFPSWATSTATRSSTRRWAGPTRYRRSGAGGDA